MKKTYVLDTNVLLDSPEALFSFDDTLLKEFYSLKDYVDNGIDRIVFNFM